MVTRKIYLKSYQELKKIKYLCSHNYIINNGKEFIKA